MPINAAQRHVGASVFVRAIVFLATNGGDVPKWRFVRWGGPLLGTRFPTKISIMMYQESLFRLVKTLAREF